MEECILFVTHIDKRGVQSRHQLLHFCQVNVADSISDVARLLLQGDEP